MNTTANGHQKTEVELSKPVNQVAEELAHILHNVRFFTKYWHAHGGSEARRRKVYWETKADQYLDSLGLDLHNNVNAVKIINL
jgi:hypothetical protein